IAAILSAPVVRDPASHRGGDQCCGAAPEPSSHAPPRPWGSSNAQSLAGRLVGDVPSGLGLAAASGFVPRFPRPGGRLPVVSWRGGGLPSCVVGARGSSGAGMMTVSVAPLGGGGAIAGAGSGDGAAAPEAAAPEAAGPAGGGSVTLGCGATDRLG